MGFEIRGPFTRVGVRWTVYVDGWPVPGYIALVDDRYAVHLGDTRALPPPSFATLDEAATKRRRRWSPSTRGGRRPGAWHDPHAAPASS